MSAKHTSGPWETHFGWDATGYPCYFIHGVSGGDKEDTATLQANAHLIAAAPELLEALKDVSRILDAVRYTVGLTKTQAERLKRAGAAIDRAEGGQS